MPGLLIRHRPSCQWALALSAAVTAVCVACGSSTDPPSTPHLATTQTTFPAGRRSLSSHWGHVGGGRRAGTGRSVAER